MGGRGERFTLIIVTATLPTVKFYLVRRYLNICIIIALFCSLIGKGKGKGKSTGHFPSAVRFLSPAAHLLQGPPFLKKDSNENNFATITGKERK